MFSLTPSGVETVLHSFGKTGDGIEPSGALINVNGTLYGTTIDGGTNCVQDYGCGTVFSITPQGQEKVLYSFGSNDDGKYPVSGVISVGKKLYGTTPYGGGNGCGGDGCGTVFSINKSGSEKLLYTFQKQGDGSEVEANLIYLGNTLYGTTYSGGAYGYDTVFAVTPTGTETVLHSFGQGDDGENPVAELVSLDGTLYGTTQHGGTNGAGTIFSITTAGVETVVHSFGGAPNDGADPLGGLIDVDGTLYGTTGVWRKRRLLVRLRHRVFADALE